MAPGRNGNPDVMVRVFRPAGVLGVLPCLYWTQGGGYVLTAPDMEDEFCEMIAETYTCVVVSVDWRRAPEHPFPAPAEDCYAGLALLVRDRGEFRVAHQVLVYPMLDDTDTTPSSHLVTDPQVWNRASNEVGWRGYT